MISTLTPNNLNYCIVCAFAASSFNRSGDVCSGLISVVACFKGSVLVRFMCDVCPFVVVNPHLGDRTRFAHWQTENLRLDKVSNLSKYKAK